MVKANKRNVKAQAVRKIKNGMIDYLIYLIVVLTFLQPNRDRLCDALVITLSIVLHNFVFSHAGGDVYYLSAAVFGFISIALINDIKLQCVCVLSMIVNFAGWLMYNNYQSPAMYNQAFISIYFAILLILIARVRWNVGNITAYSNFFGVHEFNR